MNEMVVNLKSRKIILGVSLIIALLIYAVDLIYYDGNQRFYLFPVDEMQRYLVVATFNTTKLDPYLVRWANDESKFCDFLKRLSPVQATNMVAQMFGVSTLTSRKAQEEFLACAGVKLLKHANPNSSMLVPPSRQHCKTMSFKNSGPTVALVSYPGSGNSWVRQLLESATGIYTGAVYCDVAYVNAGMIGEGVMTNNVLAVKLHQEPSVASKLVNSDKVIYIVRNPFGAILAENNRLVAESAKHLGIAHTIEVDFKYENNPSWDRSIKTSARAWKNHVTQWLNYRKVPVHIVGYENLQKNTYTELKKMLDFIGYPYTEDDILCAVNCSSEAFHRNHTKKDLHPFSSSVQKFVLNEIHQVNAALLKHNVSLFHPYS